MAHMKVNDINMYYEDHGNEKGEPIVLIAGFSADHLTWLLALEYLTPHHRVIMVDNRGAGQTDISDAPYTMEKMAQDIVTLCQQLGVTKAHFIGNSMGGHLVQTIAYRHAEMVKSVIICNSSLGAFSSYYTYLEGQLAALKANVSPQITLRMACAWLFSPQFLSQPNQVDFLVQLGMQNPYPFTVKGFEGQLAAVTQFNSEEWIHHIKVPALVIAGEYDLVLPPRLAEAIHKKLPQSEYFCFKECGHLPHVEYPEAFAKKVLAFLSLRD